MRKMFGPAIAAAAGIAAIFLVSPSACVVECRADADCAPPFFRCLQNTCVECLTSDDCTVLFGEQRMCFHGTCCSNDDRGCFVHEELPNPQGCSVTLDCVMGGGFRVNDPGVGACSTDTDCPEPAVCDNEDLRKSGNFVSLPPYSRGDGQCRMPANPFCMSGQCNECRSGQDCVALGRGEAVCCCPGAPSGGFQCEIPSPEYGCCSG